MSEGTYYINREKQIAIVRYSDTTVEGWRATGRRLDQDFNHGHFRSTFPSKERLDEHLRDFEPCTIDDYLSIQFAQHSLDDHFRKLANDYKSSRLQVQSSKS